MLSYLYTVAALAAFAVDCVSAVPPDCSAQPYAKFMDLKPFAAAREYCSSKYPIPTPVCTATTTVVATITPAPVVATESTTVTVIVTPVCGAAQKRQAKPPAGPFAHLLSDLQKQPPPIIQKLCSCIETTPPCTTSTLTVNTATTLAPATVTTTVTLSATVTAACTPYQGCTYSGTVCSTTDYCTSDESCFCQLDAVGGSVCVPAGQPCPSQSCSANADCGPGAACYVSTCCGYNACFSTNQGTCPNAARPSRMFRAREAGRRTTAAMAGVVGREPSSRMNSPSPPGQ